MNGDLFLEILEDDLKASLNFMARIQATSSFQQDMTLNTPAKRLRIGSKTMGSSFYTGCTVPDLNQLEHLWIT